MLQKMIVKTDGVNYIGRIKRKGSSIYATRGGRSEKSRRFDKYYYEAQYNGIDEKDIPNYIQLRFIEEAEDIIDDSIADIEFDELYANFQKRLKKRLQRYREKLYMNDWSYFVTFTYDDEKETAEGFEKRLIIAFNNLAKRNGWRVIGGWENGDLEGRSHFHAFIYVPDGQMVGELVARNRYSYKRRRNEIYTDNTYFLERFGMSDWIAITKEDLIHGGLANYLVKYVSKSGRRLFYSRGISNEMEMMVDTDTDIVMSYYNHGMKFLINQAKFTLQDIFFSTIDLSNVLVFEPEYMGFNDDMYSVVMVN